MRALIDTRTGNVVQVTDREFPVHPDLEWVGAPAEARAGWRRENGELRAPPPVEDPAVGALVELRRAAVEALLEQAGAREGAPQAVIDYLAARGVRR